MQNVMVVDEVSGRGPVDRLSIQLDDVRVTPRELIRQFVLVAHGAASRGRAGDGPAAEGDGRLIDSLGPAARRGDPEAAVGAALEAFEASRFVLLVGSRQARSLDEPLELGADDEVTFLRLIPLRGG